MRSLAALLLFLPLALRTISAAAGTQARLILSLEAVRPGETVMAGVLLKMAPGWHTYWRNSGDSGAPTRIDWRLPDGIKAADIQWPVPEKLTVADLTTYVYHDQVLLTVPLTVADDVPAGSKELKAQASWLECERVCLPGKAEIKAALEVGPKSKPSADVQLFDAWNKKLPRTDPSMAARAWWQNAADDSARPMVLEVSMKEADDFFPYSYKAFEVQAATEKLPANGDLARFRKLVKKFEGDWPAQLQGIVVAKKASGQASAVEISVPVAAEAPASLAGGKCS